MKSDVRSNCSALRSGRLINRLRFHSSWIRALQRARKRPDKPSHMRKSLSGAGYRTQAS